jgi:hypothetical protein
MNRPTAFAAAILLVSAGASVAAHGQEPHGRRPASSQASGLGVAPAGQAQSTDVPLSIVVRQQVEPGRWDLEFTNVGAKPVVAWSFEVIDADGRRTATTQDMYVQLLGDRPDDSILHPGVPTIVVWRASARMVATITPLAVVYADATALGDPEPIERIFAGRREKGEALADVIPRLETLAQAGLTAESLTAASVALGDSIRAKRGSHVYQGVANNLKLFSTSETPAFGFHHMLERMRREAELTKAHSVRLQ